MSLVELNHAFSLSHEFAFVFGKEICVVEVIAGHLCQLPGYLSYCIRVTNCDAVGI